MIKFPNGSQIYFGYSSSPEKYTLRVGKMNKLDAFKKYVWYKQWYYAGEPKVADSYYDKFEQHCRDLFPGDPDFEMPGYGQAHEDRLKELENS